MNKPKLVSNKQIIGGGILLAVAGAILSMVGGLFSGFGSGDGTGGEETGDVRISAATDTEQPEPIPSAKTLEVDGIMDIIIDQTTYFIQKKDNSTVELNLEEIAERAPEMTGNVQGIKVRVSRKRSSLLSAERDLEETLAAAGLSDEQVQWVAAPID
ncbi:MAG: hypothetical protein HUJ26_23275 [Planctomycetaceae bacterium]|nr:hypothetical protein [Planctomycetaceae bacterium]